MLSVRGWPYYYLVSFFLKTPYPFVLAAGVGLAAWLRSRARQGLWWVMVPAALFLLATSAGHYYATRYLFPAFPMLALLPAAENRGIWT